MAECVKNENCQNQSHLNNEMLFGNDCSKCGTLTQYADDATYHIGNKLRNENQTKQTENLRNLGIFFNSNQLTINEDKTNLIEVMIKQKRGRLPKNPPKLDITNKNQEPETIEVSSHCRILGLNLQENLTWMSHLETGHKSLLPSLRSNLGGTEETEQNYTKKQ